MESNGARLSNRDRHTLVAGAACVLVTFHSLLLARAFRFNNVDDAYIAFRYGWHLVHGQGLVFNPGERVEGYTSFLWTVLLAPFTSLPVDVVWFSIGFGLVASIAAVWGLAGLARRETGGGSWAQAALVLVALDGTFAFWAAGGLETALFTALVIASIVVLESPLRGPAPWYSGVLLGLATLTRPEGALLFTLALLQRLAVRGRAAGPDIRTLALGWAVVVLPHLLWRRVYYGAWLPNTFHNKVTLGGPALATGVEYAWSFVRWRYGVPLLALLAIARPAYRWMPSLPAAFTIAFVAYVILIGGDWPIANRFLVPVIPCVYLLVGRGITRWLRRPAWRAAALLAVFVAVGVGTTLHAELHGMVKRHDNVRVETQRKRFGMWLRDRLPPGTLIAVGPAGAIPYYSRLPSIDMWGLTDPHIARVPRTGFQPGHDRTDPAYVLARRPQLIVGTSPFRHSGLPPGYFQANGLVPPEARPQEPMLALPGVLR